MEGRQKRGRRNGQKNEKVCYEGKREEKMVGTICIKMSMMMSMMMMMMMMMMMIGGVRKRKI